MSQYKITKKRLAEIIKEEYESILSEKEKEKDSKDEKGDKLKNPEKADLDDDGKLSKYEKRRGQAIEKAMQEESLDSIRQLIQQELQNL
tara:strand:+ start:1047 stop:1313 length:267 start_codon:yes stop_codon:yes gene_type:complete